MSATREAVQPKTEKTASPKMSSQDKAEMRRAVLQADDAMAEIRRWKDKCAIVGFTDHRVEALKCTDDFAIFGLNELYRYMPLGAFDAWFEIHKRKELEAEDPSTIPNGWPAHTEFMKRMEVPIYVSGLEQWKDIPAAREFPKAKIEGNLPQFGHYATSCPAWMLKMALAYDFREIHIYGVDMAQMSPDGNSEYGYQRPCCEFLVGVATGRGIKIHLPETSDLLSSIGQYGFGEDGTKFAKKLGERITWLHREHSGYHAQMRNLQAQYEAQAKKIQGAIVQLEGAISDCEFWRRSWAVPHANGSTTGPFPIRPIEALQPPAKQNATV